MAKKKINTNCSRFNDKLTTDLFKVLEKFPKSDLLSISLSFSMLLKDENVRESVIHIINERNVLIDNGIIK